MKRKMIHKILTGLLISTFAFSVLGQTAYCDWQVPDFVGAADYAYQGYERDIATEQMTEDSLYRAMILGYFSEPVVEQILRDGYCRQYIYQLKEGGWLAQDFTLEEAPAEQPATNTDLSTSETSENASTASSEPILNESKKGAYVVIKAETAAKQEAKKSSETVHTYNLGDSVTVLGLYSNGYYQLQEGDNVLYVSKNNLITQTEYENAWEEEESMEPSCEFDGYIIYRNSYTDQTRKEIIEATGHDYQITETTPATCTQDGVEKLECTICHLGNEKVLQSTGHTPGESETKKEAGIFIKGSKVTKCTVCGEILNEEIIPSKLPFYALFIIIGVVSAVFAVLILGVRSVVKKKKLSK